MTESKAAEANARLAALRTVSHNGKMYQADDVDYMLALAETQGRGLGAINPKWFRDQAKLIKGTLDEIAALRKSHENAVAEERRLRGLHQQEFGRAERISEGIREIMSRFVMRADVPVASRAEISAEVRAIVPPLIAAEPSI